ncbi:MAG: leucyl/phenylalanyl-tRNA--protein transferase [Glaciecola sp.]|jgi:leucyl/phenylalanyl-tRNA--protein transferase
MPLLKHLEPGENFPPSSEALAYPNGLLAAGGSLDSDTLLTAYRRGIFPWYESPQPVLWWTPDPRSLLFVDELHISRSLRKTLRKNEFRLRVDHRFRDVMHACAAPRDCQQGTWIEPEMIDAYSTLNAQGWAHSIEVWRDESLVGGLYGVAIGGVFFGESMFSREANASKVALVTLVSLLKKRGAQFIDCQIESEHLNSLGARNVSRVDFENRLQHTIHMAAVSDTWTPAASCGELI